MFNRQPQHISKIISVHPLISKGLTAGKLPRLARMLNEKKESRDAHEHTD